MQMTGKEAIQELQGWRDLAEYDGVSSFSMQEVNPVLDEALKIAIDAIKENDALKLLVDWAVDCNFGYDNIPEWPEYITEDEIERLGYTKGLIALAMKIQEGKDES